MSEVLKAPFPWFGGKSDVAAAVWQRFGDVPNYIEPFYGSGAMLLGRPEPFEGVETVNDKDAMVCNFWRAVKAAPDAVATAADWPVNECCPSGTMIATPSGEIPIERIIPGMVVWGECEGKRVATKVIAVKENVAKDFFEIGNLMLTGNHPVWTKEAGYVPVNELEDLPVDELHLAMLQCGDETNLGNIRLERPAQRKGSLCGNHVPKAPEIQRAYLQGRHWRENSPRLLDSFFDKFGIEARLFSSGNRNRRLAGQRAEVDCKASFHDHKSYRWWGRNARLHTIKSFEVEVVGNAAGGPLCSREGVCNERQDSHRRSETENKCSRNWVEAKFGNSEENVRCSETKGDSSCTAPTNGEGQQFSSAHGFVPTKSKRVEMHEEVALRSNRRSFLVTKAGGKSYWSEQGRNPICLKAVPAMQRVQLSNTVSVYNFQTTTGNYFAEKILVHNCDLHARHHWLVERKDSLAPKLEGNPEWFDAKIAGWWCWGICCWIGSGWCSGDGPWQVHEVDGGRQLVHLGNAGMGVNRQLVHLGNAGMGVNRQLVHLSDVGRGETASESISATPERGVYDWMNALASRLKRVRVCCGDWKRVTGGKSGDSLKHFFASGNRCAIFLDPPYSAEADRNNTLYREEDLDVAHEVREWAIKQGDDPRLRIALCGYAGEHEMPSNWTTLEWKTRGGYASLADGDTTGKENCRRERIYFSPHCLGVQQQELL